MDFIKSSSPNDVLYTVVSEDVYKGFGEGIYSDLNMNDFETIDDIIIRISNTKNSNVDDYEELNLILR